MVSTCKKRQSNRRLLSELDDFDQVICFGNTVSDRQRIATVNEGTGDQEITVGNHENNLTANKNALNVRTLERCFIEKVEREISNIADTLEDKKTAILTATDSIVAPKLQFAVRSKKHVLWRRSDHCHGKFGTWEHIGITTTFENVSERNNTLHVLSTNDETGNSTPDEVSEWLPPGTPFDRQPHTHHMVTGQTIHINQIVDFLTGRNLKPGNPPSHQHQISSTQVSQDNNLPMIEQTPRNHRENSDAKSSINRLAVAIAGIGTQQRRQAATMLKPVSTNTLTFDGKNYELEFIETYFRQCSKCNQIGQKRLKLTFFMHISEKKHFNLSEIKVHQTRKLSMTC